MNIVFFASSHFALPSLESLIKSGHRISCVVTQPDKKKGRGLHLSGTTVKALAKGYNLALYQPQNINTAEAISFIKDLLPDLFIAISYGQILSKELLGIPKIFSMNLHGSLLPKYRGAAPINWAIIKGEKTTGVTVIKMEEKMDAGPIILQKKQDILDEDTCVSLEDKLSHLAAELLLAALGAIEKNNYRLTPQDTAGVSFALKLKKSDGLIDWKSSAKQIRNLIRGCIDWPGAFTFYKKKLLKIYKAKSSWAIDSMLPKTAGEIIEVAKNQVVVATGKGSLIIEELQIEGKRRMTVREFISGHKIKAGEAFG